MSSKMTWLMASFFSLYDFHAHKTFWILRYRAASRLFRRPSNPFPRVKTPAAYVRVRCYPPARFSNFCEGFFSRGVSLDEQKRLSTFFGFCGRKGRRDYYGKAAVVVVLFSMCYLSYLVHEYLNIVNCFQHSDALQRKIVYIMPAR